jgi:hypothetical protein
MYSTRTLCTTFVLDNLQHRQAGLAYAPGQTNALAPVASSLASPEAACPELYSSRSLASTCRCAHTRLRPRPFPPRQRRTKPSLHLSKRVSLHPAPPHRPLLALLATPSPPPYKYTTPQILTRTISIANWLAQTLDRAFRPKTHFVPARKAGASYAHQSIG